jgi:hypothetical protein
VSSARAWTPLLAVLVALAAPAGAQAGVLVATGHDMDEHCSSGTTESCDYLKIVTNFVRAGAPSPDKPVLVLDNGSLEASGSLTTVGIPNTVVDPSSPDFATTPITTDLYSAVLVASDATCGGCDLNQTPSATSQTPDSDAINARADAIQAFFNAGGGIVALAGADNRDAYYKFLPLTVGAAAVSAPFTVTSFGKALGITDAFANCCATHNSFTLPAAGSPLQVLETDSAHLAETLAANGKISGGKITGAGPVAFSSGNASTTRGTVYVTPPHGSRTKLSALRLIPVGSVIDARHGTVQLTVVRDSAGALATGQFFGGVFRFTQRYGPKAPVRRIITDLTLLDGSAKGCPGGRLLRTAPVSDARRRVVRYLQGKARGNFNIVGRHASGLERGTTWRLTDTCDSTIVTVVSGSVSVTDLVRHRTLIVRAGHSYTARAGGRKR